MKTTDTTRDSNSMDRQPRPPPATRGPWPPPKTITRIVAPTSWPARRCRVQGLAASHDCCLLGLEGVGFGPETFGVSAGGTFADGLLALASGRPGGGALGGRLPGGPLVGLVLGLVDAPLALSVRRVDRVALGVELLAAGPRAGRGLGLDLRGLGPGGHGVLPLGHLGSLQVGGGQEGVVVGGPPDDVLHPGLDLVEDDHGRPGRGVVAPAEDPLGHRQWQAGTSETELDRVAGKLADLHRHPLSSIVSRASASLSAVRSASAAWRSISSARAWAAAASASMAASRRSRVASSAPSCRSSTARRC